MNKDKRITLILKLINEKNTVKVSDILKKIDVDRTTIYRDFRELIKKWNIIEVSKWIYRKSINILKYLNKPFFEREKRSYNFNFLWDYIPNKTSFLWSRYNDIKEKYLDKNILSSYDYKQNIRSIENLLIDLSFSSSKLEWNTYSYLDTEILVKYNNSAEGKTSQETQMIINHKNAIKYIIDNKKQIKLCKQDFENIHRLLWKWILLEDQLWRIRKSEVIIWGSAYYPIDNYFKLKEQFTIFLSKLNQIKNPFEQTLFILVFIPYFQIFIDINKRTSRVWANIVLIKNWLIPFSFLQVKDRDYINAILAIYEFNDVAFMRDLFVDNYLLNIKRYS